MSGSAAAFLAWFVPLCGLVSAALVAAIKMRPANTTADAAARGEEWKRLVDWNQRLQEECETCHRERDEARAEALKWKAIAEGVGENRQEAATLLAKERLAEREEKGSNDE